MHDLEIVADLRCLSNWTYIRFEIHCHIGGAFRIGPNLTCHSQNEVILFQSPGKPSLTRWTSMVPSFAYLGLWQLLLNNLARLALAKAALDRSGDTKADIMEIIGDNGWRIQEGARIRCAYEFVDTLWEENGVG